MLLATLRRGTPGIFAIAVLLLVEERQIGERPLSELPGWRRALLVSEAYLGKALGGPALGHPLAPCLRSIPADTAAPLPRGRNSASATPGDRAEGERGRDEGPGARGAAYRQPRAPART